MKKRYGFGAWLATAYLALALCGSCNYARQPTMQEIWQVLKTREFVDLTHSFEPGIPHWPGFPDEKTETLFWYDPGVAPGTGFYAQYFCHVGQWGTHVDPPAHFVKGGRTLDQIGVKEMIMPMVVIDVHEQAGRNPDYVLTMDDIKSWESRHGPIPEGSFVAMRTDWSARWPDMASMQNKDADGISHYPGWSLDVLEYIYGTRKIGASGHETTDTDPGIVASMGEFPLETYILNKDHFQIELLASMARVPEAGALAVVTFPKPKNGSGFPARIFAILP